MTSGAAARAVIFDRDGVLNAVEVRDGQPFGPRAVSEYHVNVLARAPLERLRAAGYKILVATNQPDITRGHLSWDELERIHAVLRAAMPIDEIFVCPHDNADECACRKPKPGLLQEAARKYGFDLSASCFVGDTWRDMDAARAAGCRGVLIDAEYNRDAACDVRVGSVAEAVEVAMGSRV